MADINWTKAQQEAIEAQGGDILVSAAAGSGKTAVLVERVVRMITRREDPCDIDSLVIMTFTKAAAAQMKDKISRKLREELRRRPQDIYLRQQIMKVTNARICTIDSLCAQIVRDHFQNIDLDPGYKMADDAQLRLLKKEVLSSVMETMYQEKSADFLQLADYYTDKNDKDLENIVLTLYGYAQSHPEPEAWLRGMVIPYQMAAEGYQSEEDLTYAAGMEDWMPVFAGCMEEQTEKICDMAVSALAVCQRSHGPYAYEPLFLELLELIRQMSGQPFDNRKNMILDCLKNWKTAPRITAKMDVDPELKEAARKYRDEIRDTLKDLLNRFFYDDLEAIYSQMGECLPAVRAIRDLTLRFSRELAQTKKERKLADFSDIAHYALKILIRYNGQGEIERDGAGRPVYTEVADQMARGIREVIVDEYQDTNMLQEYLVQALSARRFGRPDVFMVGDVKQSIYRFRMACPELFQEKMEACCQGDGKLVILDSNFRSRKEILDLTNMVFGKVMTGKTGGIEYRQGHALTYGGLFGPSEAPDRNFIPEILMISGSGEQARSQEALAIASRIETLVSEGRYHFSDIVILTRVSDNPQLEKVLYRRGIPIVKNTGKGFFDSFEVRLTLDLLRIIDNPLQDIPLAAVLFSPLCSASADDLARIRLAGTKKDSLYDCLLQYKEDDRFLNFTQKLLLWQEKAVYMGAGEFLPYILQDSGLDLIAAAMPQGEDRRANLAFLKSLAQADERVGNDLFSFLRYIREMQNNQLDYGTMIASESVQAVTLMTIHHAKGLEFPVVILAMSGKEYNETDLRASILPDRTLGLGIEYRDMQERVKKRTILMETIIEKQKRESRAEEMRLLYVAMTRAKEKLIITGSNRSLASAVKRWERAALTSSDTVKPWEVMSAVHYLSLLGLALHPVKDTAEGFCLEYQGPEDAEEARAEELLQNVRRREELLRLAAEEVNDEDIRTQLEYHYPYENATMIEVKLTASSLENRKARKPQAASAKMAEELIVREQEDEAPESAVTVLTGAQRGSIYHAFLEHYNYQGPEISEQLKQMEENGWLDHTACSSIDPDVIRTFLQSVLGRRMAKAAEDGRLYREKQFMIGYITDVNSGETLTGPGVQSDITDYEQLLVQGRIDAWFIEDGQVVLVDYKTDRIRDEEHYRMTYAPQLAQYADALERCLRLPVKEQIIYSFELGREVIIEKTESRREI